MRLSSSTKALIAGISGTTLQWYDFILFGYFSTIIAKTYFPAGNAFIALLSTFDVFAVGYLLAPIGSLIFGYIGDKYGRKKALTISILAMAIPTSLISIVPGYEIIGIAAPILLTLLRIIQGIVASAEFAGSAIFLVEHAKPGKTAFYGCLTSSAYSTGVMLAGLAASFFTASFMPDWGWRLGFALALIGGILIYYLRIYVNETPEYESIKDFNKPKQPFLTALREAPLVIIGVIGIAWMVGIMTFGTYVFAASYLHTYFNLSLNTATLIVTVALLTDAVLEPFIATLADKIGHLRVIKIGVIALLTLSFPAFYLISSGNTLFITTGMICMSIIIAITYAPLNAYMVLLFPKKYRYSGFGVSFHIGISLFGGTTPLVMLWLIHNSGNVLAPAWYYVFGAGIGLCSLVLCEFARQNTFNLNKTVFE